MLRRCFLVAGRYGGNLQQSDGNREKLRAAKCSASPWPYVSANPSRGRNFATTLVVVVKLRLVIGCRSRHRMVVYRTETRGVIRNRQRGLCRVHRLAVSCANQRLRHRENAEWAPIHV